MPMTSMNEQVLDMESLKQLENNLQIQLCSRNSANNSKLEKHRHALLNATHFLKLYHQSASMAAEVISNSQNSEQPMNSSKSFQTTAPSESDFLILQNKVLFGDGMRLIWDAYHNDEILRANLISNYIGSCSLHSESLEYFIKQSSEYLLNTLFQQPSSQDGHEYLLALSQSSVSCEELIHFATSIISLDIRRGLHCFMNFMNALNSFCAPASDSIAIFVEKISNFCEFPCLRDIVAKIDQDKISKMIVDGACFKQQVLKFISQKVHDNISTIDSEIVPLLEQAGLETDDLKIIKDKFNALTVKSNTDKLKNSVSDIIDRIMKCVQNSLKSGKVSCLLDQTLQDKLRQACNFLTDPSLIQNEDEFVALLTKFDQVILNKTNIIATIHLNELSSINASLDIPSASKLFLAVLICDEARIACDTFQDSAFVNTLLKYVDGKISKSFYKLWLKNLKDNYYIIQAQTNELMALCWLSEIFVLLNVKNRRNEVLTDLGINVLEISDKFRNQSSLIAGLLETNPLSSPKLPFSSSIGSRKLLPHFITK